MRQEFWWRFFPKKELSQIYLSVAIRSLSISMLGLFIPLYLHYELGISLVSTLLFYAFYSTVFGVMSPVAAKFASRFGIKHTVLFSLPFYLFFIGSLFLLPKYPIPLLVIASAIGISWAFYWFGMNLAFYHASHHNHRGEEVGKQKSLTIIFEMIGPLLGGILIVKLGFQAVFAISIILLFLAFIVLLAGQEKHIQFMFSMRSLIDKKYWRNSLYYVSRGSKAIAGGVIWPLFIFTTLGSYISLGVIGTIMASVSAILVLFFGKYSDHKGKRTIIRWGIGFEGASWIFKAAVNSVGQIFGATIFGAVMEGTLEAPLGALEYDKAKGEAATYFVNREIFMCLGRILLLLIVLMTDSLSGGLIFQGVVSLLALLF